MWQPAPPNPRAGGEQLLLACRALPGGSSDAEMTPVLAASWNTGTCSPFESTDLAWRAAGRKRRTARSRIQVRQGSAQTPSRGGEPVGEDAANRCRFPHAQLLLLREEMEGLRLMGRAVLTHRRRGRLCPRRGLRWGWGGSAGGAPGEGWGRSAYLEQKNQGHRRS